MIWAGGARKDELKVIADDVSMMMIERDVSMREVCLGLGENKVRPGVTVTPRGVTLTIGAGGVVH